MVTVKPKKKPAGVQISVCVWCGHQSGEGYRPCNAPDGDGHLYNQFWVEIIEADKYYGKARTGHVLLKDGVPFQQGSLAELKKSKYFQASLK